MTHTSPLLRIGMAAPRASFRYHGAVTPERGEELARFLAANAGRPVLLVINSPGGHAFQGTADAAEIERHGNVVALGQGIIASAATCLFLAARKRVLHRESVMMIHDPAMMGVGTADNFRKAADDLDKLSDFHAEHYARQTGHSPARIRAWMKVETWMTADEAVALNFADSIEKSGKGEEPAEYDYSAFMHAPERLVRMADANGWATASPEHKG